MMKVVLAGTYPEHTYEKLCEMLPKERFDVVEVNTQQAFDQVTDAEVIILRIFKAGEDVILRNPKLKMILRWGAGFDTVDIEAAGKQGVLVTNTPGANETRWHGSGLTYSCSYQSQILCTVSGSTPE